MDEAELFGIFFSFFLMTSLMINGMIAFHSELDGDGVCTSCWTLVMVFVERFSGSLFANWKRKIGITFQVPRYRT